MTVFVLGCVALGLALGYLLNSRSPGSSETAGRTTETTQAPTTSTTAKVLGERVTQSTLPPVTVPTAPATTTTRPAPTTTTTARAAAATTKKTTKKPTTATTRRTSTTRSTAPTCAAGNAGTSLTGNWDPATNTSTVVATVDNPNSQAIVVDKLVVHLVYADGSERHVTIVKPGDAGTSVAAASKKEFTATDPSASSLQSMDVEAFAVHYEGQPACASQ